MQPLSSSGEHVGLFPEHLACGPDKQYGVPTRTEKQHLVWSSVHTPFLKHFFRVDA
jgi:hypothetical protein